MQENKRHFPGHSLFTVLGGLAMTLGACVSAQKPAPTSSEIKAVTEGKFLREAVANLQKRNFACKNSESVFIEDEQNRKDYIYCDGSWNISPFVWRRLQVALYSKENKVYEVLIADGVTGP